MRIAAYRAVPGLVLVSLLAACAAAAPAPGAARAAGAVATTAARAPTRIDLAGNWKYLPYNGEGNMAAADIDDASWPAMSLPSNWFLLGRKQYPSKATAVRPPFGDNAPGELWPVDPDAGLDYSGTVWFRRTVDWQPHSPSMPVVVDLDMVDYYATVFLNGVALGSHEGYFQHWSVDATKALHPGHNTIAIKVSAPAMAFDMSQQYAVSWPKMQHQIKGIFAYHDTRPGATSARGQERSTGGVLRGVSLRESTGVDLTDIVVTPLDVSTTSARLVIDATVRNWTDAATPIDGVAVDITQAGSQERLVFTETASPDADGGPAGGSLDLVHAGSELLTFEPTYAGGHNLYAEFGPTNFNFGNYLALSVPEPTTWATMLLGLGLAGVMLRRRNAIAAA